MINKKIIIRVLGFLLILEALFMLSCIPFSIYYSENDWMALALSSGIILAIGLFIAIRTRDAQKSLGIREGYIIVSLAWLVFSLGGMLPFYFHGSIPSITDAFFETMSGFTTTGSTILTDIEALPHALLFWRSMTQWLGGMGIIVLSLAILPILGIGGMQLFVAEVPGPTPDKLHPRVTGTAKRLWGIYILFTFLEIVLLMLGGMSFFDAINHAFTTMATGGYSTKNASIAAFPSPYIQYVITFFMFVAGTNFTLSYFALHGKFNKVFTNEEFRFYTIIILVYSIFIGLGLFFSHQGGIEKSFRDSLFQVVSIITTTGYITSDYLKWGPFLIVLIFTLMFLGGSAGSTGGGIKIVRILILMKNSLMELKRLIHPKAIIPVRLNKRAVPQQIVTNVLAFTVLYLVLVAFGTIFISATGGDFETSVGAILTCLGNIGPGLGKVGPVENFAHMTDTAKWFLSFNMLLGRLELFTVLILFSPNFWKK